MSEPNYLIQTADGVLNAYWDRLILRCDVAANGVEGVKFYKRTNQMGAIRYVPCTLEEIRAEVV
jgi:hypothetical protein